MIPIAATSLPLNIQQQLRASQSEFDSITNYAERVKAAEAVYKTKRRTVPFKSIVAELKAMCAGVERCMYCEDSCGVDIEHFRPKSFYPELTFVWANYLYACTKCNRPKLNQFGVYAQSTGQRTDLIRAINNPVVLPEPGDPLLIDPFEFLPSAPPGTREHERAKYIIEILKLNDTLPLARLGAYGHYHARLEQYVTWRSQGKPDSVLLKLTRELQRMEHPTVWFEMKRQQERFADLRELFEEVPEALQW